LYSKHTNERRNNSKSVQKSRYILDVSATTPRRNGRIEKQKQKRKDATTQELLTRTLGLLEENAEFDDNALAAFSDKFKTPLSPRSITMLGSLVKKMEKVKKPKERKVAAKKKTTEIT
jgi:hypothetical protein